MEYWLTNACLVTQNQKRKIIRPGAIKIKDGYIEKIIRGRLPVIAKRGKIVDLEGAVVMPGLINAHVHLGEIAYRGFIDNVDTRGYIAAAERLYGNFSGTCSRAKISSLAILEHIQNGVTTIAGGRAWPEAEKLGVRNVSSFMLMRSPKLKSYCHDFPENFYTYLRKLNASNLSSPALMIHSLNFVDRQTLFKTGETVRQHKGLKIFIHLGENKAMDDEIKRVFGASPVTVLDRAGLLGKNTFLIHVLYLNAGDWRLIAKRQTNIITCPASNILLEKRAFDIARAKKYGINVMMATDGPAANNSSDLLNECKIARMLYWSRGEKGPSDRELLDMVTVIPARALSLDAGSLEPGNLADLVILNRDNPSLYPLENIVNNLIMAHSGNWVDTVIVGGRMIYKKNRLPTGNTRKIIAKFNALYK